MMTRADLADLGIVRIGHGPLRWIEGMKTLTDAARSALA